MSLVPFHKVLISSAIVFGAGFTLWQLAAYLREGRLVSLLVALAAALATLALAFYLRRLARFLKLPALRPGSPAPGSAR